MNLFELLEDKMKCPICKEIINGAVILECGHSYCSLCLRKYLEYKEECPTCRIHTDDGKIIKNSILEDLCRFYINHKNEFLNANLNNLKVDNICQNNEKERKLLPKLFYNDMSQSKIKELLENVNLPTNGSKEDMIKRHKQYVLYVFLLLYIKYNAECDKKYPMKQEEIIKKVIENEKYHNNIMNKSKLDFFHKHTSVTSIKVGEIWKAIYCKEIDKVLYYNLKDKILQDNVFYFYIFSHH